VAGGMKKGLKSLEDTKQDEMMFMEIALRVRMRHEFDKEFGKTLFSLSYRDKVIIISFPASDGNVLLVFGCISLSCTSDLYLQLLVVCTKSF